MAVVNEVENGLVGDAGFNAAQTVPGASFTFPTPPGGPASAFPYAPTASIAGNISPAADQDYYAFQFTAGQVIRFDIDGVTNAADLALFFYGPPGAAAVPAANDQPVIDTGSTSVRDPFATITIGTTGLWRIGLQSGNATGTPYTLHVSILDAPVAWTGTASADTLVTELGADTLDGAGGDDSLVGGQGNDIVQGGAGADTIEGDAGAFAAGTGYHDTLRGGTGGDRLVGSFGNDRMEGGDGADTLFGDAADPAQLANAGNDTLYGAAGADSLAGGAGRDLLNGGTDADTLEGGAGADRVSGGDGDDVVYGSTSPTADTAPDTLDGGEGNDTLWAENRDRALGGGGDDRLFFTRYGFPPDAGGVAYLNGGLGNDLATLSVFTVGSERVVFTAGSDGTASYRVTGDAPEQEITVLLEGIERVEVAGGGDRDEIRAGSGADMLLGNGGASDLLIGGIGADTIYSYFEPFRFLGAAGASQDVVMSGGAGDDLIRLQGEGSSGVLDGGAGNDLLFVEDAADAMMNGASGADTLRYDGGTALAEGGTGSDLLLLNLTGAASAATLIDLGGGEGYAVAGDHALDLTGIERILVFGSAFSDSLEGGAGGDTMIGAQGADTLRGGLGKDLFYGLGADGLPAADRFVWTSVAESAPTLAGRDAIFDWNASYLIDLSAIDANAATPEDDAFTFGGTTTTTANAEAGTIRTYVYAGNTYVIAGINADVARDFQIEIGGVRTLTAANFVL